jgi:hypothetical protein
MASHKRTNEGKMNSLLQSLERLMLRRDPRRNKIYLTRAAWLLVAVIVFFGVAAALLGINQLIAGWGLQPLDRPAPTVSARPEATPTQASSCAVSWRFIPSTPVPGLGYVGTVDDPQVIERVKTDYVAAWRWMYATDHPWNDAQATWFYRGVALDLVQREIARHQTRSEFFQRVVTGQTLTDLYFTDATRVFFGDVEEGITKVVLDAQTLQEKERVPGGEVMMWQVTMVYDQAVCRWMVVEMGEKLFKRIVNQ